MKERIIQKLNQNLTIKNLQVINKSDLHLGHLGDNGSGETHFEIIISAKQFDDKSKIFCHRQINNLLKEEFEKNLHSLEIKII